MISTGGMYVVISTGGMYVVISTGGMYVVISTGGMYVVISTNHSGRGRMNTCAMIPMCLKKQLPFTYRLTVRKNSEFPAITFNHVTHGSS
jgi:hypothetical protein